ncbi:MAG: MFS transporter [Desulfopila sp.]|nr:MFS transporter [Desulfopila sp.]
MSDIVSRQKPLSSPFSFTTVKWTIFSVLILSYILVYFHRMAPGVVSESLMVEFNINGTRLGTLAAIYFFVYAFMQIPSGVLADTLGTRTSIIAGNVTAGAGSIIFALAPSFETACLGRFLVGLGVSVVFVSIMKNNSVWFEERFFGIMSGVTLLFGNLGSILAAGPLSLLLSHYSWRTVFVAIGIFSLCLGGLGVAFVRNRPEDLGFPSPLRQKKEKKPKRSWLKQLFAIVSVSRIWPGFWVQFGMVGGLYSFMGLWAMPFLRDTQNLSRNHASDYVTLMLLSFAVGALFFGWFSDRIGRRKPVLLCGILAYVGGWIYLLFFPWSNGFGGYLLFCLMGFSGSSFVLTFACAKEIVDPDNSGMAVSVVNTGCFVGTALMQPMFGWLADLGWDGTMTGGARIYSLESYQYGFTAMLLFGLLAFLGGLRVRETGCRNISETFSSSV